MVSMYIGLGKKRFQQIIFAYLFVMGDLWWRFQKQCAIKMCIKCNSLFAIRIVLEYGKNVKKKRNCPKWMRIYSGFRSCVYRKCDYEFQTKCTLLWRKQFWKAVLSDSEANMSIRFSIFSAKYLPKLMHLSY